MTTLEENPQILIVRRVLLTVDIILSVLVNCWFWNTIGILPSSYRSQLETRVKIARRNLQERTEEQAESNKKLSIPHHQPGFQILIQSL